MATANPTANKVKVHSFIIGLLYMAAILGALYVDPRFIYAGAAVAGLQIISILTNFCPVYFILHKLMPEGDKLMNGPQ